MNRGRNATDKACELNSGESTKRQELLPRFEVLFEIIRTDLEGEIGSYTPHDTNVDVKLPDPDGYDLEFCWLNYEINSDDLAQLTFRVAQLRPIMERYHSLQKIMDATVSTKQ